MRSSLIRLLTSMHPSKPETFVFTYSCFGSKLKIQPKPLFVEGSIKEISSLRRTINEGDYMLVDHKHKNNFYKTTKVHISNDFAIMVNPYNFVTFQDLIAMNLNTHVVVSTNLMKVIIENLREKRFMNLVDQDLS
uniref:Uncharacterized protein n=1 Tax=Lactuca sativa TaxID=4236 RepID=A0A9R1UJF9_LACSA|nr:hypothetical protein LSAT_V11C900459070 [Lactuca sativa]